MPIPLKPLNQSIFLQGVQPEPPLPTFEVHAAGEVVSTGPEVLPLGCKLTWLPVDVCLGFKAVPELRCAQLESSCNIMFLMR